MKPNSLLWLGLTAALAAAILLWYSLASDPVSETRAVGQYRVTVYVSEKKEPRVISVIMMRDKERFALPVSLFDDIRTPHIGPRFDASEFKLEVTGDRVIIRIRAGEATLPDDHAWILPLPLNEALRISREGLTTGYSETHKAAALIR